MTSDTVAKIVVNEVMSKFHPAFSSFARSLATLNEKIKTLESEISNIKSQMSEYIALEQQKSDFVAQISSLALAVDEQKRLLEEASSQSEAQYLMMKRKLEELNKE